MKKVIFILLTIMLSVSVMAQQKIQLRSADRAECTRSDMTSLQASFSFSTIEAQDYQSERGTFSGLSLPNTVIGGNEGDPQIPVVNELIAVPFGANPRIEITSYSTTDYRLEDYGMHTLMPRQPDIFKNQDPNDVPFVYNEAAYQTRGLRSEPMARVSVNGTMRGVQVGQLSIEPVSYDPVNNTIRVFNNIEVKVFFDGADARATEDMLVKTYSPYFDILYKQLFNGRAVRDVYDEHPDLWTAPVKMLVIANRMFESCIQDWVAWKTLKGIYVDVNYTDNIGTSADAIKSFIQTKYAQDAPTFLIIMGDKDQVVPSVSSASNTSRVSDLYYSSVDGDEFVDMFHSRMSAQTVDEMTAIMNKGIEYEQYTMPDPSYLNKVLLIAGEDSGYGVTVGRPTIWYASNYYYNAAHGFSNVYEFSQGTYTNCYAPLSSGVGFANYTAHGSQTSWAGPSFSVSDVNNLTNEHKYFYAMGNCCQSGDWGYSTCFGESLIRAENKGAFAYIGSCPNTTWYNDYYFGVGATTVNTNISSGSTGTMPTMDQTTMGCYDGIWTDDAYNTVNSVLYTGLLACNAAQALGYQMHSATLYYWQAYHCLGDGSIMPYRVQPTANNVSHMAIFPIGMPTYEVSAVPGSYVAISKDGVLYGTALVDATGTVQVPITPVTSSGDVTICVTAPNRIPYIQTVPAAALEGPYIAMDSYTPTASHVGDNTNLSITFKNVGTVATSGNTNVTLTSADPSVVTIINDTGSFGTLAANGTTTVTGFSFKIAEGVVDGTNVIIHYTAVNGNNTYEGNIVITATEAVLEYEGMAWNGSFTPGETLTLSATFKNTGHYQATNAVISLTTTNSDYITINTHQVTAGTIEVGQEVTYGFSVTIAANCPETEVIPVIFTMTADGGLTATGNENLRNACNVVFVLVDSRNDGWDGNATLKVSFDDGSPDVNLTLASGASPYTQTLEIGNGVHVTLTWIKGTYDSECSFTVSYEGDLSIYQMAQGTNPAAGVLYEFDCNCAAASQVFMVNVSSSNAAQGSVSGGGEFNYGETCTVTATPVEGFYFMNWTKDGEVVSTSASYSFIVNSDVNLVANFTSGLNITVGADPSNAGTVSGGGTYGYGATCTVTATPAEGYYFTNWTQNDEVVSSAASYSFTVSSDMDLVAHFVEGNMIGDGGSSTDQYLPSYSFYNYSLTQQIYTVEELGEAGIITSIAFFNGGSEKTRTYDFYLKTTTKSSFSGTTDWEVVTEADKVFSGSVTMVAGGWTSINFDTPFVYNGSTNVVLVADDNTGSYSSGMLCRVFDATNQSIRVYSDGTNYDPFTPTSYDGTVMSVKNQILLTKEVSSSTDTFNVTISANPEEGGTVAFDSKGDRSVHYYDFEDGTQGWTILQGPNSTSPHNWMHNTEYLAYDSNGSQIIPECHNSSSGMMLSESYISASTSGGNDAQAVTPDNYLVSPQIQLGGSITFYAKARMSTDYAEKFSVLVSESGNTSISDFIHTELTVTMEDNSWHEYTVDLSQYSGMGYVAIRHYDCYDQHLLYIDDITIVESDGNNLDPDIISATFNFGESCTVTATPNTGYSFMNWTKNGTVVSSNARYTFTVTSDLDLVANFVEGLMIGDGSTTTDKYLPSFSYYNYTLSQQIYTAEELGSVGLITSIAFFNGGTTKTRLYDIYMVNTTKSEFTSGADWVAVTSDNLVFSGSVEMTADDWTTITFSTPFLYDGVSNVVLVVDDNTGSYEQGMLCRVFDAPNQALRIYSDPTNYDPFAPSSYSGTVMSVKNQIKLTKSSLDGCVNAAPTSVEVNDITHSTAAMTWMGFSESYNVCLGVCDIITLVDEDFAEAIPAGWANSTDYPWTIVDGHMQSSNGGVAGSTSNISFAATFTTDGTIEFDAECMGEGTSSIWDKCIFSIDDITQFTYGANVAGWNHYSFDVTAGEHTFTWSYTKDSSVDPDGDYFAIDNVLVKSVEITWSNPVSVEEAEYTFIGLIPSTDYCARVQGVCEGNESVWSGVVFFTTHELTTFVQTIELTEGWNWVSTYIDADDVLNQLKASLGTNGMSISTQGATLIYRNGIWIGGMNSIDNAKGYKIKTNAPVEVTIEGQVVDPANCPIPITEGANWIGYPLSVSQTVGNALTGFTPSNGDVIMTQGGTTVYRSGHWLPASFTFEPGKAYIYNSTSSEAKTLIFTQGE